MIINKMGNVLIEDMKDGNLYVVINNDAICAVFALVIGEESVYSQIEHHVGYIVPERYK